MVNAVISVLHGAAHYARWVLVAGLLTGLAFQDIAHLAIPSIPWFIALLLLTASFRIGPVEALGALSNLKTHLHITLLIQLLVPFVVVLVILFFELNNVYTTALVLVLAAAPISGSPNLVIMLGHDPAPALRQLVVGTALLPLTVIPIFLLMPSLGDVQSTALAAAKLLLIIGSASVIGFFLRWKWVPELTESNTNAVDGVAAIAMAVVVVALMSALGDAWRDQPSELFYMLVFAFALNFGLQVFGYCIWHNLYGDQYRVPMSVISGNRNVALYLAALPLAVVDELLLFVGCYQFPMYLTPLLLQRFYQSRVASSTLP